MINRSQVRIGIYLQYPNSKPFKVDETCMLSQDFWRDVDDNIEPVPLSIELLGKFGFERTLKSNEDYDYLGILNFTLIRGRTTDDDFGWFLNGYHNDCHILYIHQLQNLYQDLTGEELQIK
jgi:hypothetical protein